MECDIPVTVNVHDAISETIKVAKLFSLIKSDLSLWTWGGNSWGQYGNGTVGGEAACSPDRVPAPVPVPGMDQVISVSCGCSHVLAIKTDGSLWGWGDNYFSTMGNDRAGNYIQNAGSSYASPLQTIPVKIMENVSAAKGAFGHTMVIKQDGTIWGWGENAGSQLGFSGGNYTITFRGAAGSADQTTQFENKRGVQTVPRKMENFVMW